MTNKALSAPRRASYFLASLVIAALTGVLIPLRAQINSTTIGFGFLLVVLAVAIIWDCRSAQLGCSHSIFHYCTRGGVSFQPEQSDALILVYG